MPTEIYDINAVPGTLIDIYGIPANIIRKYMFDRQTR
jgi:hypothetical protein